MQYPTLKNCLSLLLLTTAITVTSMGQDLPAPSANLQILPPGSYIIGMDNINQQNSASLFNLKAYGLAVHLLNNQVKLKWIITAGKAKDGTDFSVTTTQLRPVLNATAMLRDFKAGPFVIFSSDTAGVASLIDGYYAGNSITGNNRPNVYVSTAAVTVDQRYDLSGFKPMAAILSDGGNQAIHQAFMTAASIPSSNYTVVSGLNLLSNCYTFASEPHNSKTGTNVNTAINNIHMFVASGGNFLAECAAVPNYENNALGQFQTTAGITVTNTAVGTTVLFPNPDLSYSQFQGVFNGSLTGSVENWQINAGGTNSEHNHVTGSGANATSIAASVSKLVSGNGGLAFYLGNHNYSTSDQQNINGIRMYMNAFLTPAYQVCPSVLPIGFINLLGQFEAGKNALHWSVSAAGAGSVFNVEKSIDGSSFYTLATIPAKSQTFAYTYKDPEMLPTAYYRIREIDQAGKQSVSSILQLEDPSAKDPVSIYPGNNRSLVIYYTSSLDEPLALNIYNAQGQLIRQTRQPVHRGSNLLSVNIADRRANGMYIITITSKTLYTAKKFLL